MSTGIRARDTQLLVALVRLSRALHDGIPHPLCAPRRARSWVTPSAPRATRTLRSRCTSSAAPGPRCGPGAADQRSWDQPRQCTPAKGGQGVDKRECQATASGRLRNAEPHHPVCCTGSCLPAPTVCDNSTSPTSLPLMDHVDLPTSSASMPSYRQFPSHPDLRPAALSRPAPQPPPPFPDPRSSPRWLRRATSRRSSPTPAAPARSWTTCSCCRACS